MPPLLPSLAAACLYAGAALYQGLRLQQRSTSNKRLLVALGTLALLLHGGSLFLQMFDASGLSLDFFKAASLIAAAVILLTLLACMRIPVENLLLLLLQDHQLKHKPPSGLIKNSPPLQTMESLLFGFLWAGWALLSLSLLSGALFISDLFAQHLGHKTILSCFAWVVFAVLLWGRHQLGWRGHKAIRWTLAGFCLLMLAYFGSKLVREFILHI